MEPARAKEGTGELAGILAVDASHEMPPLEPADVVPPLAPDGYWGELRANWRPLLAASLGAGAGLMLMSYTTTLFGPFLIKAFGWTRPQFALIGLAMMSTLVALPFIGRLADRFGVRRVGTVGALGIPACLVGYSLMNGSFAVYFALSCLILLVGSFSSPVVYTRLIASHFRKARGLALTFVTITPAVLGAVLAPVLTWIIDDWGWRTGYRVLAAFVLVASLAAVLLAPDDGARTTAATTGRPARAAQNGDFRLILSSKPFWIIAIAMFLCCLQTPLHSSQMALMLADNRLGAAQVALMISTYSLGTIIGRFLCGLALDRFPNAAAVAALSMMLPAIGYALLASSLDTVAVIGFSMLLVGVAFGAEGDLQSFLVARHFDVRVFSTTLGLVYVGVFAASALGAVLVSVALKATDSFAPFLALVAVLVAAGSALFLLLPAREGPKIGASAREDMA